jgi:molecular chaperone Hsp33
VRLACAKTPAGWRAAALILERVATGGGIEDPDAPDADEAWLTATTLAATVTDAELLDDELATEQLIWRLFSSEGVAADRPRALAYGCRCSRSRLAGILEGFVPGDLDDMVVSGDIVMTCEFCNLDFRFPRDEVRGRSEAD